MLYADPKSREEIKAIFRRQVLDWKKTHPGELYGKANPAEVRRYKRLLKKAS